MNGYFQLVLNEKGTSVRLVPPTEEGEQIKINELIDYLKKRSLVYDTTSINGILQELQEETIVPICAERISSEREKFEIFVSPDSLTAVARFYPPSTDGVLLSEEDIVNDLKRCRISYGIDTDAIKQFVKNRVYGTDIVLAKGDEPRHGEDAKIEYFFKVGIETKPQLLDDGSVDFHKLNLINHCNVGSILARLFPADEGETGKTVYGDVIKPRDVKKRKLKYGRNIQVSPDKTILMSGVNGHVNLFDDKVFVSNVLTLENVDLSTGDIDYDGSVTVNGNIATGFTVKATGNVEVQGVVEGATIEAGGNIILKRGIHGMAKAKLRAGGNIIAKFIESAIASCNGYVGADSILHSTVSSKTEVNVTSKKGFIAGGTVTAMNAINVKNLGSELGASTVIEVGITRENRERMAYLQRSITEIRKILQAAELMEKSAALKKSQGEEMKGEQLTYLQNIRETCKVKKEQLEQETTEYEFLQEAFTQNGTAQVNVSGEVYPGVKIIISNSIYVVQNSIKYCKFIRSEGTVKMTSL